MKRLTITLFCIIAWIGAAASDVKVSLLTCYPGEEVYELDGHTALRVKGNDFDMALSWGVFDFNSPNFVYRFVKGETDYMVAAIPTRIFLNSYARDGRKVVEQDIPMDSAQVESLMQMLERHLLPQNRVYRYNYVKDNCATRPLHMIEAARGDTFPMEYVSPDRTFRQVMQRYHKAYPWYQFGIDMALGSGIDYGFSPREQSFSPMLLMKMLPSEPRTIIDGPDTGTALPPTPRLLSPMAVMLAVLMVVLVACAFSLVRRKLVKWLCSAFYGIIGVEGCVLAFLIFVSVHEATSPNWLFIFFNPLCLIPAIFIWVKSARKLLVCYQFANFALIISGAICWPFTGQYMNPAVIPVLVADITLAATYLYITLKHKATDAQSV